MTRWRPTSTSSSWARAARARRSPSISVTPGSPSSCSTRRLPSDQPASTHFLQPPALEELDVLGIGDRVRESAPALRAGRFAFDDAEMLLRYRTDRPAYCVRRSKLDAWLYEAALAAGAVVRARTRVVGVVRAGDGRVTGVEVRRADGQVERLRARLVVGADGRGSTIAKLVAAKEYLGYDGPRATYWAYWRRPEGWNPSTFFNGSAGLTMHVLFPCDGDLVLIATSPPTTIAKTWRRNHEAAYLTDVRACAKLTRHLRDATPVSDVRGCFALRYFFRAAAGPGWALAGDAGHHKEFVTGLGIADALRDAKNLTTAIRADTSSPTPATGASVT